MFAFHLEHADRVAGAEHLEGLLIVERNFQKLDIDAAPADEFHRDVEHRQGLQAEEIELHEAGLLYPFHVELADLHVRPRIAVERHQSVERPVADDDAGGMGRGVAVEAFELLRDDQQPVDHRIILALGLEARLVLDRLLELDRVRRILRHELAEPVDLAIGHLQHAPDIAEHGAGLQRAEGDDLRHLVGAVFLLDVLDHLVAPVLAEVDVEVGHRHAVGVEEALEEEREAQGVEIGDGERPGDHRAGARAAAGADRDALLLGPLDEVGDDQEIARIFHPDDHADLIFETILVILGRQPRRHAVLGEPIGEALPRGLGEQLRLGRLGSRLIGIGTGKARQNGFADGRAIGAAHRDLDRVLDRLGNIGEERHHLGA
jgi:hypothetical protein